MEIKELQTPFFLVREAEFDHNLNSFQKALDAFWPNSRLGYSVKTNSLPWILRHIKERGVLAEVVSDEEYLLARRCGHVPQNILFNGPIKSWELLAKAAREGSYVNLDSVQDLSCVRSEGLAGIPNLGIRINIPPSAFEEGDVGYTEDGFRFGFSDLGGGLAEAVAAVSVSGVCTAGMHLHCNSLTRSVNVYRAAARYAMGLMRKYHWQPAYIDMGGGFFGGLPGKPTAEDYIKAIAQEFASEVDLSKTRLLLEPGVSAIGSAVDFHSSVLDVKDTGLARIVTTDGSRVNLDPLWKKTRYPYEILSEAGRPLCEKQIICGYTCMDHDRIMQLQNEPELRVGDRIVYPKIGAYTVTFGGPFIRYFPDVYVQHTDGSLEQVRCRMTVEDYYRIHSID